MGDPLSGGRHETSLYGDRTADVVCVIDVISFRGLILVVEATVTDSPGGHPYGYPGMPVMKPGVTNPYLSDPGFEMDHEKVKDLGDGMGKRAPVMTELSGKIRAIQINTLTFGAIGGGLNVAHTQVRDSAADAVEKGREVLESWKRRSPRSRRTPRKRRRPEPARRGRAPPRPPGIGGGKTPSFKGADLDDLGVDGPQGPGDLDESGFGDLGKQLARLDDGFKPPGSGDVPQSPGFDPPGSDALPKPPGSDDVFPLRLRKTFRSPPALIRVREIPGPRVTSIRRS